MPARRRAADISRGLGGGTADGHAPLVRRPEIDFHLDVRFTTDRMKIALVAGVRPRDDCRLWLVVGRAEAHTPTLAAARLYAFTRAGCDAANAEAKALQAHLKCDGDWISFVWRVLVEGPWERPMAVTPVWVLDGCDHPINVKYYFAEPDSALSSRIELATARRWRSTPGVSTSRRSPERRLHSTATSWAFGRT